MIPKVKSTIIISNSIVETPSYTFECPYCYKRFRDQSRAIVRIKAINHLAKEHSNEDWSL